MKKILFIAFPVFALVFLFGCSKDDDSPGSDKGKFKVSDFTILDVSTKGGNGQLDIDYAQKNTTSMNYDSDSEGYFRIKWKVKTTDGNSFQTDRLLATELDAGATESLNAIIEFTASKTIDVATLTYEVYRDK
ncbi:hypothetical protein [Sphingobacterium bovistauri]|uniref:Lipocalin-like domain-containing protein n=1 Tax=Sphingobacterium bovistauri TaxID=2781959 RepID=A0ABS7Z999_9SPHI|nr:hypothetical protein [Sphingobacterium bovistauri]MCA5006772.1 hypothetical protein [Sphingobacterium bovistauri]